MGGARRRRPAGSIRPIPDGDALSNVASWRIEGPWLWITAIGVRVSVRHGDITFGGSHGGGVRLDFRERVPVGPFRVPALYVTVDDLEGFAAALTDRGIQGVDARKRVVAGPPM